MADQPVPRIADFERVLFFTGAGISAESGVPTYRGAGGIWKEYDYQRYACQTAFDEDPERVWEFHNYRRELVGACAPNPGHEHITRFLRDHPNATLVTQNIDGLHQLAGADDPIEVHGSLWRVRCDACGAKKTDRSVPFTERACACGEGIWRPDITWFGDGLDQDVFQRAFTAASEATLVVSVGTSGVVFPAAQIPLVGKQSGATLVEVNPEETAVSAAHDVHLRGPASEMLAQLG
jgi:NAD-dependent deacetylase